MQEELEKAKEIIEGILNGSLEVHDSHWHDAPFLTVVTILGTIKIQLPE